MRYTDSESLDAAYNLIAAWYESSDRPDEAMAVAAALVELGEDRSWASVWWAYGAIHHDLRNSSYDRALDLLSRVDVSPAANAAALMLQAEIELTSAIEQHRPPDISRQSELLSQATVLVPDWPNLRVRLARALVAEGDVERARQHAAVALKLLDEHPSYGDPFEIAISGYGLDREYVFEELRAAGLL